LIGIPYRVVIDKKLTSGMVELVERKTRQAVDVAVADAAKAVQQRLTAAHWSLDVAARPVAARLLDRAEAFSRAVGPDRTESPA
jgi:hypothetical protein